MKEFLRDAAGNPSTMRLIVFINLIMVGVVICLGALLIIVSAFSDKEYIGHGITILTLAFASSLSGQLFKSIQKKIEAGQ